MSDLLVDVIRTNSDTLPFCFYGKYSRFGFGLSMDGRVQIHIAKCKDPDAVEKRYDNDNRLDFTLDINECFFILKNIDNVITGKYSNPKISNEKFKNTLILTHYPDKEDKKKTSQLWFSSYKDGGLSVSIIPPSGFEDRLTYILKYDPDGKLSKVPSFERNIFYLFLKEVSQRGIYDILRTKSILKTLKSMIYGYDIKNKNSNNTTVKKSKKEDDKYYNNTEEENSSLESDDDLVNSFSESSNGGEDLGLDLSDDIPF